MRRLPILMAVLPIVLLSATVLARTADAKRPVAAPAAANIHATAVALDAGRGVLILGPSGAGKSSLLRLLTLGARPQAGRISLFGSDVTDIARRDIPAFRRRMVDGELAGEGA